VRAFNNYGVALLGVSLVVSLCTLPLYFRAEYWQKAQRAIEKKLAAKTAKIKAVFSGDEQHLMLAAYYKQNGYSPVFALRSSLGILIQIPFFIAAYHYIAHLDSLRGVPFLCIRDLSAPDALLRLSQKWSGINVLPLIMTLINCVSSAVYSRGFAIKDKLKLYGMALIFLALLYRSPAGLVIYWTANNICSLLKNIFENILRRKKPAQENKKNIIDTVCNTLMSNHRLRNIEFCVTVVSLFIINGILVPAMLIASSPQEFSFIGSNESPFSFIKTTMLQASGFFLFWAVCIYGMFSARIKSMMVIVFSCSLCLGVSNLFIFSGNYSNISVLLTFSNIKALQPSFFINAINLLVSIAVCVIIVVLASRKTYWALHNFLCIVLIAMIFFSAKQLVTIHREFSVLANQKQSSGLNAAEKEKQIYLFSSQGKNVLIIMLDRAIAGFIPAMLEERPELADGFDGFVWYKNCISSGGHTIFGAPPLFGGYEYTPREIQKRKAETLKQKHNEALMVLPKLFLDAGYHVAVTDPPFSNYSWTPDVSIFNAYPEIAKKNIIGLYTDAWLASRNIVNPAMAHSAVLESNLIRFSFFRLAPPFLRNYIYDGGDWLGGEQNLDLVTGTTNNYIALDMLDSLTKISDENINTCNILTNDLTHNPAFLQAPDYTLANVVSNFGNGKYSKENHYHVNMAAFLLLKKYFQFLKDNHCYDNTRIIIASDHGFPPNENAGKRALPDNQELPNGDHLVSYIALLLVKDFASHGQLREDDTFMTNADVPLLAVKNILPEPVINPFTGNVLQSKKENGVTITTSHLSIPLQHALHNFRIKDEEWLTVRDDIYRMDNWSKSSNVE
jgi:YidC/Oxa1 family membrane protein insertase